ncbi:MAG: diguanylate cyclase [Idiomarina sp.]
MRKLFLSAYSLAFLLVAAAVPSAAVAALPGQWEELRTAAANNPAATLDEINLLITDYESLKRYYDLAYAHLIKAEALRAQGEELASFAAVTEGIKYAQVSEARFAEASLRMIAVEHHYLRGNKTAAEREHQLALALAEQIENTDLIIETRIVEAQIAGDNNQLERALNIVELLDTNYHSNNARVAYIFHSITGEIHRLAGSYEVAVEEMEEALELAADAGKWHLSIQHYNLGLAREAAGQTKAARDHYQTSMDISAALGDDLGVAYATQALGLLQYYTGDYEPAMQRYMEALPAFIDDKIWPMEAWMYIGIAETLILRGKADEAPSWIVRAEELIGELDDIDLEANLAYIQAQLATAQGQHEQALSYYQDYAQLDRERQLRDSQSSVQQVLKDVEAREKRALSERDEARATYEIAQQQRDTAYHWLLAVVFIATALVFIMLAVLNSKLRSHQLLLSTIRATDAVANLPNRKEINRQAQNMITRALTKNRPFALAIIRLYGLKQMNNQFGHDAGDKLISEFSDYCQKLLSGEQRLGRINGAQWLLLLPDFDESEAANLFKRITDDLLKLAAVENTGKSSLTAYMGYAQLDLDGESFRHLFERCEEACHKAQQAGPRSIQIAPMPKRLLG